MRNVKTKENEIVVDEIVKTQATFHIIGVTPLIFNAMSAKSVHDTLCPPPTKTRAEKETTLRHNPREEYVHSTYRRRADESGPTRLLLTSRMFKSAIADVAKRVPGSATTAAVKQLAWVEGLTIDLYGIPQIFMAVVRNSDINRTVDVRTRAIVAEWACEVSITFMRPQLTLETISRLLNAAGILNGVGDYRQQKGAGNYGQFELTRSDDPRYVKIREQGGMVAQDYALNNPDPYDQETTAMLEHFDRFVEKRELRLQQTPSTARGRKTNNGNGTAHSQA